MAKLSEAEEYKLDLIHEYEQILKKVKNTSANKLYAEARKLEVKE